MNVRGWVAIAALAIVIALAGCSRADPSIIAAAPPEAPQPVAGAPAGTEVAVAADATGQLRFEQTTLTGPADLDFTVTFNNPVAVPHNWVMVEPGQEEAVAQAAAAQNGDPTGVDGVIAGHTPIASAVETINVEAMAAGTYPYICTVPGHFQAGMAGEITLGAAAAAPVPPAGDVPTDEGMQAAVSADPGGSLRYLQDTLSIPADQATSVTFTNPAPVPHNWVLVEPGQEQAVAQAAQGQAGDATTNVAGVIAATPIISGGTNETVDLPPLEVGTYEYICTVPGHFQAGMHGTLTVGP